MKKKFLLLVSAMLVSILMLSACGGQNSIVGTWVSEEGEILSFKDNGSCSVPFTYNNSWWESCDLYTFVDGTLVLSSSEGNISSRKYEKCDNIDDITKRNQYYLSNDTLVINEDTYKRGN